MSIFPHTGGLFHIAFLSGPLSEMFQIFARFKAKKLIHKTGRLVHNYYRRDVLWPNISMSPAMETPKKEVGPE